MATTANEVLEVETPEAVADKGYYAGEEMEAVRGARHHHIHPEGARRAEAEASVIHQRRLPV